jgi:hypothetical protein
VGKGSAQNLYRAVYACYRLNSLGRRPAVVSAAAAHETALTVICKWYPNFEPEILSVA